MFSQNSSTYSRDEVGEYQLTAAPVNTSTQWQPQFSSARLSERKPEKKGPQLNDKPGPAWLLISTLVAAAIATGIYFVQQGHLVGTLAAPLLLFPALHGIWRGGTRKILMLFVLLATVWCLVEAPALAGPYIQQYVPGYNSSLVHILVAGTALPVFFAGLFVIRNIRRKFILPSNTAFRFDRFVGALAGMAEGGLMVLSICWVSVFMAPQMRDALASDRLPKASLQRNVVEAFVQIADESQRGKFGEIVARTNILDHVPELRSKIDALGRQATGQGGASSGLSFRDIFNLAPSVTSSQTESLQRTSQEVNRRMENLKLQLPSSSKP